MSLSSFLKLSVPTILLMALGRLFHQFGPMQLKDWAAKGLALSLVQLVFFLVLASGSLPPFGVWILD